MPQYFDNFNTPIELAITARSTHVTGPSQPTGTSLTGSDDVSVPVFREISLQGTSNHPAAAVIVKDSPLVLLTTPTVDPPVAEGLQALKLIYRGPAPTASLDVEFSGSAGIGMRLNTAGALKIAVVLFPTNGAGARRWHWGGDAAPGSHHVQVPWSDFWQVQNASPGNPDSEPILLLLVLFTITHPEKTPLIVENVSLY